MQKLLFRALCYGLFLCVLSATGYCAAFDAQVENVCPPGFKISSGYATSGAVSMNASKPNANDAKGALVDREMHVQYDSTPRLSSVYDNVSMQYQEAQKKLDADMSETRNLGMAIDAPVSKDDFAGGTLYLRKNTRGYMGAGSGGTGVVTYSGTWIGIINNHFVNIKMDNVVDSPAPLKEAIQYMVEKTQ